MFFAWSRGACSMRDFFIYQLRRHPRVKDRWYLVSGGVLARASLRFEPGDDIRPADIDRIRI